MRTEGQFVFKTIEERKGGKFVNSNGQTVTYNNAYVIKVDELENDKIYPRTFKFSVNDKDLFNKFSKLNPYEDITIEFIIRNFNNNISLIPVDVIVEHD